MNSEEHDRLWALLGKARTPSPSPFFSRNVLRQVRMTRQREAGVLGWFRQTWRTTALSLCALSLMAFGGLSYWQQYRHRTRMPVNAIQQVVKLKDYETISHLDELLAFEENSIWLESSE